MNIAEKWTTKDIWLRRHFAWKDAKVLAVTLEMFHDDDVEIYLNGTRIFEKGGSTRAWETFSVPEDRFLSAVKDGDNILAVKVHDVAGSRYFDCGLTVKVEEFK